MSRFLLLDADGETILATLTMTDADARLHVGEGQSLAAIDPETDGGASVDDGVVKYSQADGLVLKADGSAVAALADLQIEIVAP